MRARSGDFKQGDRSFRANCDPTIIQLFRIARKHIAVDYCRQIIIQGARPRRNLGASR